MSNEVSVIPATVQDVPVILSFIRELVAYHKFPEESVTATEVALRDNLFGSRPRSEVLMARDIESGQCVGMAIFFEVYSCMMDRSCLHLDNLYVKESYRGSGVGGALLERLAVVASERRCVKIEWKVLKSNTSAVAFYEKRAVPLTNWRVFRWVPDAPKR